MQHKPHIIILTLLLGVTPLTLTAQDSYTENGKTYHRPGRLTPKQLDHFADYTPGQQKIITTALATIPKPWLKYKFGGSSPQAGGFDCSGATYHILRKIGYQPPRTSVQQYLWVKNNSHLHAVPDSASNLDHKTFKHLKPGDLLFWKGTYTPIDGRKIKITHVAIYLGKEKDGRHVMASSSKGRSYRGKRCDGFGVFDFKLPRKNSRAKFIGYGTPPVSPGKTP